MPALKLGPWGFWITSPGAFSFSQEIVMDRSPLGQPLNKKEVSKVMKNTAQAIDKGGLWLKVCGTCKQSAGGRLAEYGKPTPEELEGVCCPNCGGEAEILLEYVPPVQKPDQG